MKLSDSQKKTLRGIGHGLKPVVTVGANGITDALLEEFDRSLEHHELMKVKINVGDRQARDDILQTLCQHAGATLIQRIGHVGLLLKLHRKNSRLAARLG